MSATANENASVLRTWFITGASKGLGLEIAKAALEAGHNVAVGIRKPQELAPDLSQYRDRMEAVTLDVTDRSTIEAAVQAATSRFGRIDVLVNNAGFGQLGPFEETSSAAVRKQFDVNVFGAFEVTRAVLPVMRHQRAGHIITISSTAGIVGFPLSSIYCASKFAVAGWSESLTHELEPFGVKTTVIHPGQMRTNFLDSSSMGKTDLKIEDYEKASQEQHAFLESINHKQGGYPHKLGLAIVQLASLQEPPMRFAAGTDAIDAMLRKADSLREVTEEWKTLSESIDFKT